MLNKLALNRNVQSQWNNLFIDHATLVLLTNTFVPALFVQAQIMINNHYLCNDTGSSIGGATHTLKTTLLDIAVITYGVLLIGIHSHSEMNRNRNTDVINGVETAAKTDAKIVSLTVCS